LPARHGPLGDRDQRRRLAYVRAAGQRHGPLLGRRHQRPAGYANTTSIGDDETPGSVGPVDLGAGRSATAISAGGLHTCALLDNGSVRCWGTGGDSQLGYANTDSIGDDETPGSVGPVDLGAGRSATTIDTGDFHTCALLDDGTVRCWGNGPNGQLGYANTADIGDDEAPGSVGPVDLGAGRSATAIGTGGFHTCALLDDGTVRCWGFGFVGSLGYANTADIGDDETPGSVGPVDLFDDAPVAVDDTSTVVEDDPATAIDVLANEADVDAGPKAIVSATDPAHGTVTLTGAAPAHTGLTYTPDAGYCNNPGPADTFTYTLTGEDGALTGGSSATVSVTVTCVDDAPVAVDDSATVVEDDPATAIDVLANDSDVDAGPKAIVSATDPAHGTVTLTARAHRPDLHTRRRLLQQPRRTRGHVHLHPHG
jgi:hypothetical protein